jgi:ABC-type glucose/galactose transport system permease subunit
MITNNIYYVVFLIFFQIIIIMNNNLDLLFNEYKILSDSLNKIFINTNKEIINLLLKKNIKTRNNKISFSDVLLYKFLYAYKNDR